MVRESFDVISKDASVINNFKKDHSATKVYKNNNRTTNFYENLLLKSETYVKYDEV
jgi:hypothetical protein